MYPDYSGHLFILIIALGVTMGLLWSAALKQIREEEAKHAEVKTLIVSSCENPIIVNQQLRKKLSEIKPTKIVLIQTDKFGTHDECISKTVFYRK